MMQDLALNRVAYMMFFVKDMLKSVDFYSRVLGVPVISQDSHWAELQLEGFKLALHLSEAPLDQREHPHVPTLVFSVDDIIATRQALLASGVAISQLTPVAEMGEKIGVSADFRDPEGHSLSIYSVLSREIWDSLKEA
jgi:catechol 2,3-dioxygenase-like lactoylglutathione lyase family enzyme